MAVAIIGGGLAGLSCAYRLKRAGIDATVFEESFDAARSRLECPEGFDGFVLDVGAQYLLGPDVFQATFTLIRELGMADDILAIAPIAGQLYKRRIYHHRVASATGLLSFKGLGLLDKAMLPKMAFLLSRYGPTLNFQQPELGVSHDDESVAAFVKRELSQNILNYVAGPLISTLFLYPSHETSKLLYLLLAKHMQNTQMYTLRGGIGRLAERLMSEVPVVKSRIDDVRRAADGFLVNGQRFSDVVLAVPGNVVLKLQGVREMLSAEDVAFFEGCPYQRALSVFVATDAPADGQCYALSIPAVEKMTASTIAFHDYMDPSRVPAGAGLLAISGGGPDVTEQTLLADLQSLYSVRPLFTRTFEWASGLPKFPPGRYREIEAFNKRQRIAGLHFCGDYLMGPFVDGAIGSGFHAAQRVSSQDVSGDLIQ